MENLKQLFTEEDFKLLNDAIDALPKVGFSGMMLGEMLLSAFTKDEDPEKRERERTERIQQQEKKDQEVTEKCLELKFKILQLKKALQ
ncbi:hypothetical protein [Chryseobacterium arthrosphaerae]|uniref:hypothetical protein n=1 Tax=Chryseobacterium arthrosphaerae TaxID=651561 RepID=UPI00142E5861|nr:hypothetical protein [Chryseobacterium arthrosphaerae]